MDINKKTQLCLDGRIRIVVLNSFRVAIRNAGTLKVI